MESVKSHKIRNIGVAIALVVLLITVVVSAVRYSEAPSPTTTSTSSKPSLPSVITSTVTSTLSLPPVTTVEVGTTTTTAISTITETSTVTSTTTSVSTSLMCCITSTVTSSGTSSSTSTSTSTSSSYANPLLISGATSGSVVAGSQILVNMSIYNGLGSAASLTLIPYIVTSPTSGSITFDLTSITATIQPYTTYMNNFYAIVSSTVPSGTYILEFYVAPSYPVQDNGIQIVVGSPQVTQYIDSSGTCYNAASQTSCQVSLPTVRQGDVVTVVYGVAYGTSNPAHASSPTGQLTGWSLRSGTPYASGGTTFVIYEFYTISSSTSSDSVNCNFGSSSTTDWCTAWATTGAQNINSPFDSSITPSPVSQSSTTTDTITLSTSDSPDLAYGIFVYGCQNLPSFSGASSNQAISFSTLQSGTCSTAAQVRGPGSGYVGMTIVFWTPTSQVSGVTITGTLSVSNTMLGLADAIAV